MQSVTGGFIAKRTDLNGNGSFQKNALFRWDVLNLKVKGDIIFLDLDGAKLPFEIHYLITGAVVGGGSVQTPAGNFETTAKIQYKSKITTSILDEEDTIEEKTDTVWLAPGVGIVKVENEDMNALGHSYPLSGGL